ncbi:hypothetical protein C8R44DRAFT_528104, partial [Mycena epipterygia]
DPPPSRPPAGSFQCDLASPDYQKRWESWTEFQEWLAEEQRSQGIDYRAEHDHALGNANLPSTQIPKDTREYIAGLLRLKVSPDHILQLIHRGVYNNDNLFEQDLDSNLVASRTEFIQLRDLRRIEKDIEAESVRLNPDDGLS